MIVATYNVRHCRGLDGRVDVDRVARVIFGLKADVVALQELDRFRGRSGRVDQPAAIAQATGFDVNFYPTVSSDGAEYGIALATRSGTACTFHRLPRHGGEEPRGVITTNVAGITILGTHVATKPPARDINLAALAGMCEAVPGPVVLAGDLNVTARGLGPLIEAGLDPGPRAGPTLIRARRRIDWVLAGGGARVTSAEPLDSDASDHRPLRADIALPKTDI